MSLQVPSPRWLIWGDREIVPHRFRNAFFRNLASDPQNKMTKTMQDEIITELRAHPDDSMLIYGPAGTGKTHFSLALLEKAVAAWAKQNFYKLPGASAERSIFRVSTKTWVDEMFAYKYADFKEEDGRPPIPKLNVNVIRALAKNPNVHIFVIFDEIDKFGGTDARLIELFEIVNLLSEVGAQIIATSNQSPEQIKRRWKNSEHTDPILRRFYDNTGGAPRRILVFTLPREPRLTVQPIPTKQITDPPFALQVTSRSKGAFTYAILDGPAFLQFGKPVPGVTEVVVEVELTGEVGVVKLEVSQAEWENYRAATTTVAFKVVKKGEATTALASSDTTQNPAQDPAQDPVLTPLSPKRARKPAKAKKAPGQEANGLPLAETTVLSPRILKR
jgi:hypothetical protein